MANVLSTDTVISGTLSATALNITGSTPITQDKLQHQHRMVWSQPNTTATTETRILHVCMGATGTVLKFEAGSIVLNIGAAVVTVDLLKNGTTMLAAPITLDTANTAYVPESVTPTTTAFVDGDVLTTTITATAGGGTLATGVYVALTVKEDAA